MGRISVVVPIYDVEDYLVECLRSLARQTVDDFEAILVDDGSTDASGAIAERFAATDERFRLLRRPNGGLSRARNAGVDAASGEFLAFLDSDDVLPPNAYELLLGSLGRTGSDFATGNVHRLTAAGCVPAPFLAAAFGRTRERTHVRRFAPLLDDRTAWNKLWRRSFWDGCELRFPDGRLHEDIPVVLPAHFHAATVDVIGSPVYHYRVRDAGAPSITQRRHELRALRDRLAAVDHVHGFICTRESARQRRRYERTVVAQDLRYHLDLLPDADDEYRALFMEWTGAFLDGCSRGVCDDLPAIDRVKYHLVRRGRLEELIEMVQFGREHALSTSPRRRRGRYYGNYPVGDVPRAALRLGRRDKELALTAHLDAVRFELGRLVLTGRGHVNALGAPTPDVQAFEIAAVRAGARRALRMRIAPRRLATAPARRSDLEPRLRWAGFRATLDPKTLIEDGAARWELFAYARSGGLRRRRAVFSVDAPQAADVRAGKTLVRAAVTASGRATVTVADRWVCVERHRRIGNGIVELAGTALLAPGSEAELELVRADDGVKVRFPLAVAGGTFRVQIMLAELGGERRPRGPGSLAGVRPEGETRLGERRPRGPGSLAGVRPRGETRGSGADGAWDMAVAAGLQRPLLSLSEELSGAVWRAGARDMTLERTADGGGRLLERELAPRRDRIASEGGVALEAWPPRTTTSLS